MVADASQMYDGLQEEFAEAQEAVNTQSAFVAERNEATERLTKMIDYLREISRQQSTTNAQMASELRDEILQQMLQLVDTLNRFSQASIPVEQAFDELNDNLSRKEKKGRDLQAQYDDLNAKDATLDQDVETRWRKVRRLRQQNDDANDQVRRLMAKLQDACSGGNELGRIESLFWSWKSRGEGSAVGREMRAGERKAQESQKQEAGSQTRSGNSRRPSCNTRATSRR
jgi:chromosome segregation ATPase